VTGGLDGFDSLATDVAETEDDAPDGTERKIGVFPDPDLLASPVTPLGFVGGKVVFAMPEGEIRTEYASKIQSMLRVDIFSSMEGRAFLTTWRDSDDKFQAVLAAIWFVDKCRKAGLYDTTRPIRGLGVWPGDSGAVVLHRGEQLVEVDIAGKVKTLTIAEAMRRPGPLYRLRPRAPEPKKGFEASHGQWIRETLDLWRFEPIGLEGLTGADIVLGWIGAAMLGAVAPFRGHLLIHALAGAGKTTLMYFLQGVMSALAGDLVTKFSEPGMRAELSGNARPVHIDEAESRADAFGAGGAVEAVMELLRDMATGEGANRKQGSTDGSGGATTQTAIGSVVLAAINPPLLTSQDATRVVEVKALPLGYGDAPIASDAQVAEALEKAKALAPLLLGRVLRSANRYRADIGMIKAALTLSGQSPRAADLIAMLAAGRRMLLFDRPLTAEEATAEALWWSPLLVEREDSGKVSNPGADAMAHLLAWESGQHVKDRKASIGELLEREVYNEKGHYTDTLKAHGLLVRWGDGFAGAPFLYVANKHPGLSRIFKGTPWPDWTRALRNMDVMGEAYLTAIAKPLRYGAGEKQRGTVIPLTPWFDRLNPGAPKAQDAGRGGTGGGTATVPGEDIDWNGES
jgi:hypothetical protein